MWFPGLDEFVEQRINRVWRRGDDSATERIARQYARLRPHHSHSWALLGNILITHEKYEEAESMLRQYLQRHPSCQDPDIGWLLGESLRKQGRLEEARAALENERRRLPQSRLPYLGLAYVAAREGNAAEAEAWATKAEVRTPPDDYGGRYELALILAAIPPARERAEALARGATQGMPNHALSEVLLGLLLELRGDPESAVHMNRARELWDSPIDFDTFLIGARDDFLTPRSGDKQRR